MDDLATRSSINTDDGPVAVLNSPQWSAWADYYRRANLRFHLKTMQQYKWRGLDWPVPFDMPPASLNLKNKMPWPRGA